MVQPAWQQCWQQIPGRGLLGPGRLQFLYSQYSAAAAEGEQPDSRLRTKFNQTPAFSSGSASQGEADSFIINALKEMVLHSSALLKATVQLQNAAVEELCGETPISAGFGVQGLWDCAVDSAGPAETSQAQ